MTIQTPTAKPFEVRAPKQHKPATPRQARQPAATATRPMSERARWANREWYPGLSAECAAEHAAPSRTPAGDPGTHDQRYRESTLTTTTVPSTRTDQRDRWERANREWYPGLCTICNKMKDCTYPKPEGGVFHCEEYE